MLFGTCRYRYLLGVLTAAALLWALVSGVETALAAGDTVTTELQPGWNLASWTGNEADVEVVLAAIPQLVIAYAWDAHEQRYRFAYQDGETVFGDLARLSPGMGLWLFLEGQETVPWERPLVLRAGLADLRRGWNLVTWAGDDGIAAAVALAELDAILLETRKADGSAPQTLERGRPYWLRVSSAKQWWQLTPSPHIDFQGEFTPERKRELRAYVDDVVAFFVRRHGVAVPGLTVQFGDAASAVWCGGYGGRTIGIREPCITALPHEYTHAVQEYLATLDAEGNWGTIRNRIGPAWLSEGMANHAAAVYHDVTGHYPFPRYLDDVANGVWLAANTLEAIESDMSIDNAGANYSLASLAALFSIEMAGEAAPVDFYRQRPLDRDWRDTYHTVFDLPIDAFYELFESHRAGIRPTQPRVEGIVQLPLGDPQQGIHVRLHNPDSGFLAGAGTRRDGTFRALVPEGDYEVLLYAEDYDWCHLGAYSTNDSPPIYGSPPRITVTDAGVTNVTIQLPGTVPELCRRISGTILGPTGDPMEGVHVRLHRPADGVVAGNTTDSQGRFSVVVPNGLYEVLLYAERHDSCYLGAYDRDADAPVAGAPPLVDLRTEDPAGIVIQLPQTPAEFAEQNCG